MRLRVEGLTWQRIDDDIVVLDLDGSSYLKLNASGAALWEALADGCDHDGLVSLLVERYEIASADADRDVRAFIANLEAADLLARD